MFTEAVFLRAPNQKQPKRLSTGEWRSNCGTSTPRILLSIERAKLLIHAKDVDGSPEWLDGKSHCQYILYDLVYRTFPVL